MPIPASRPTSRPRRSARSTRRPARSMVPVNHGWRRSCSSNPQPGAQCAALQQKRSRHLPGYLFLPGENLCDDRRAGRINKNREVNQAKECTCCDRSRRACCRWRWLLSWELESVGGPVAGTCAWLPSPRRPVPDQWRQHHALDLLSQQQNALRLPSAIRGRQHPVLYSFRIGAEGGAIQRENCPIGKLF